MARYEAEARYIASIFPSETEKIMQYHGPRQETTSSRCTVYHLPKVVKGEEPEIEPHMKHNVKTIKIGAREWCAIMEITDGFENIPDIQPEAMGRGRNTFLARPVACERIASNLLTIWVGSITGLPTGATPGIIQIQGTVPTQAEIHKMKSAQQQFYEVRLAEGDRLFNEKNMRAISQQMKDAAIYLGRERTWSGSYGVVGTTDCPHCFESVNPRATVCPHCQRDIKAADKVSPVVAGAKKPEGELATA